MFVNAVSIAKAVGIILMVLAHTRFSEYGNLWINMFHMPLFFFLSGYCFKDSHLSDPKNFVIKKVKGLWLPFFKWMTLFAVFHNLLCFVGFYSDNPQFLGAKGEPISYYHMSEYPSIFFNIVLMKHIEQLLGGFWFLKTLFYASLIGFGVIYIKKCCVRVKVSFFLLVFLLLSVSVLCSWKSVVIPYLSVGSKEFLAALFFLIGYIYKSKNISFRQYLFILIPLSVIFVTIGMEYWQMTLLNITWWKIIPYLLGSMLASLTVFEICKLFPEKSALTKYLVYIGDNTMTILTWHMSSFKLVNLIIIITYGLPYGLVGAFPAIEQYAISGWFFIYLLVGIAIPCLFTRCRFLK